MKLSPHFTLHELTHSATAKRMGINNDPSPQQVERMRWLCVFLLEPVRAHFGRPVRITSGYRCPELNRLVGGARNSAHQLKETDGRAATDFQIPGVALVTIFDWLRLHSNLRFDLVILERGRHPRHENDDVIHLQSSPAPHRVAKVGQTHGRGSYRIVQVR